MFFVAAATVANRAAINVATRVFGNSRRNALDIIAIISRVPSCLHLNQDLYKLHAAALVMLEEYIARRFT